ncbi:hypothetical protein BEWA_028770 [Theileria equi strain WA]|uniref:Signal peptide containing protein n=1 Tax=Theileria equi strain WA TaxID=1537102 RepID=L0AWQ9_THEEQ|nr:hypothetical protein BEWA_028770 [Theileria equi strain WA]AFZ80027.1 hypothetical protein BEWA_028770 [Theileria equi strain WA]|eukprot:XP_004829693.1 hypothetical protein BEWA_028770 [Theileria equi strain WA]
MKIVTLIVASIIALGESKIHKSPPYKNWTTIAKKSFERGKLLYDSIYIALETHEKECRIIHSYINGDEYKDEDQKTDVLEGGSNRSKFPCIKSVSGSDLEPFDIDINPLAIPNHHKRIYLEGSCLDYILNELNTLDLSKCDAKGDSSRSLIALAKTKCHFIRAARAFPTVEQGCVLNPKEAHSIDYPFLSLRDENENDNPCGKDYYGDECEELKREIVGTCTNKNVMSETAFQMYHAELNHIGPFLVHKEKFTDDICFYLQSGEWNRRTEENINRLADSAMSIMEFHKTMETQLDKLKIQQIEQMEKAEE